MPGPSCQHHPEEAAVGICVRCQSPLCDACITKLDGINHCRACLLALEAGADALPFRALAEAAASEPRAGFAWLSFTLGVLVLAVLAWSTLTAVLPAGGP